MASVGGTAHRLGKRFKNTKVGNAAWKSICEWYDGYVMKNETEECLRPKLDNYRLTLLSNTENYTNIFLTTYGQLKKIPGEFISDSHVLLLFLSGITYPYFQMTIQIQQNNGISIMDAVIATRKQERKTKAEMSSDINLKNRLK